MRRTARALSVAALIGVVLGFAASAAWSDPAAEVSPGTVSPGGSVNVSVSCDTLDGQAPTTVDATSQAFEEGTVQLKQVSGNDEKAAGPAYSGTARVPPADNFEGDPDAVGSDSAWTVDGACPAAAGGEGKPWSATFTVTRDSDGGTDSGGGGQDGTEAGQTGIEGGQTGTQGSQGGTEGGKGGAEGGMDGSEGGKEGGKDGNGSGSRHPCADSRSDGTHPHMSDPYSNPRENEAPWGAGESHAEDCGSAAKEHGVQAGAGGAFTDSVPALIAGGVLIAGAMGGALYRLRRKSPAAQD
ncbi:hypothetical protein [Streptomyces bicolor]|uniref:hypothetical protein n=1 Tax=Streptomyces bicolor TaxID=66874 RepID=UPI0004E18CE5|nr:hypothetical protein [Streptomyces bicolor]